MRISSKNQSFLDKVEFYLENQLSDLHPVLSVIILSAAGALLGCLLTTMLFLLSVKMWPQLVQ